MKRIFEPYEMHHLKVKNRLVRSATWEGVAEENGALTDSANGIYEELAKGGVGTIIVGFTSVSAHDHYFENMMRLSSDDLIPQFTKLTDTVHGYDCRIISQIALGAYYRYDDGRYIQTEPDDMTVDEISDVLAVFRSPEQRTYGSGR